MHGNCLTNHRSGKWEFSEVCPKVTRPGESHNEFAQQIWVKSDLQFVCKRAESASAIRGRVGKSVEGQKVIRPGACHDELIHQIQTQSDQCFICKCVETSSVTDKQTDRQRPFTQEWLTEKEKQTTLSKMTNCNIPWHETTGQRICVTLYSRPLMLVTTSV